MAGDGVKSGSICSVTEVEQRSQALSPGDLWEPDPSLQGKPAASDHLELFIGYTLNHSQVCQGCQDNHRPPAHSSEYKPTHTQLKMPGL